MRSRSLWLQKKVRQSVAAVCLEQDVRDEILTVRLAAVDTLGNAVREALDQMGRILSEVAEHTQENDKAVDKLFDLITTLHHQRILARLRSSKWVKPTFLSRSHKKPLWQDFANLIHRVQFLYTKKESSIRKLLEVRLEVLAKAYLSFEDLSPYSDAEHSGMTRLICISYDCCTSELVKQYAQRLNTAGKTAQVRGALKTLKQLEKIAAYYRVSSTLVRASQRYARYFRCQHLQMAYLPRYSSIPTAIRYEDWAKTCHVHAEIQLVIYYDTYANFSPSGNFTTILPPRVMGTSKYLCYLCYLFIKSHGSILTSKHAWKTLRSVDGP